ncbi:MAG TPA: permease prefix domain 1-containing protein [Pirellulales bacterium]|nr:permease prefix domain 1-containing protein [Pirellulales bacterium]
MAQQQSGVQNDDLDELESHLRDTVAALGKNGLSTEEALVVAVHRLGSPQEIAVEFAKIDRAAVWINRLVWILAGYMLTNLGALGIAISTRAGQLLAARYHVSPSVAMTVACYAPFALIAVIGWALYGTRLGRVAARVLNAARRTLSTPSLAIVSCALILSAYQVDFLLRRLSFTLPFAESQRVGQRIAVRDGFLMILGPMAAAVVALCLVRYRRRKNQSQELAQ